MHVDRKSTCKIQGQCLDNRRERAICQVLVDPSIRPMVGHVPTPANVLTWHEGRRRLIAAAQPPPLACDKGSASFLRISSQPFHFHCLRPRVLPRCQSHTRAKSAIRPAVPRPLLDLTSLPASCRSYTPSLDVATLPLEFVPQRQTKKHSSKCLEDYSSPYGGLPKL